MQHASAQHKWLCFFVFFIIYFAALNHAMAHTSQVHSTPVPVLAYFIGYHSYDGLYNRPGYINNGARNKKGKAYWTGWRYIGHGCQKSCYIDQFSGKAIRCKKRC